MDKSRRYLEEVVDRAITFYNGFLEIEKKISIDIQEISPFDLEAVTLLVLSLYNINLGLEVEVDCYSEEFLNLKSSNQYIDYLYSKLEQEWS